MEYNAEKKTITIFGKSEKLDALCNKLAGLNGEQVYSMFSNRGILVPRRMNCLALYSVINEKLKKIHASDMSKDAFMKLKYYKDYSEYQLTNLFNTLCNNAEDFKQYRVNLMKLIILNHSGLNLNDGEISYLKTIRKQTMESFSRYQQFIVAMEQEQEGTFDGVKIDVLKGHLATSASASDIIALGDKYGITIPEKMKRDEIAQFLCDYLKREDKLTPAMSNKIKDMNATELNALCKVSRVQISSSMTKPELIYYLFYTIGLYTIPTTSMRRVEIPEGYALLDIEIDMTVFKGFKADNTKRIVKYPGWESDPFEPLGEPNAPILGTKAATLVSREEHELEVEAPVEVTAKSEEDVEDLMANLVDEFSEEDEEEAIIEETAQSAPKNAEVRGPVQAAPAQKASNVEPMEYDEGEEYEFDDEEEQVVVEEVKKPEEPVAEATPVETHTDEEEEKNDFFDSLIADATKKDAEAKEEKEEEPKILRPHLPMDDVRENTLFGDETIMKYVKSNKGKVLGVLSTLAVILLVCAAGVAYFMFIKK